MQHGCCTAPAQNELWPIIGMPVAIKTYEKHIIRKFESRRADVGEVWRAATCWLLLQLLAAL